MKGRFLGLLFLCMAMALSACAQTNLEDMKYVVMPDGGIGQKIQWGGITYTAYGLPSDYRKTIGKQIGMLDGDKAEKVYEVKGQSPEKWLVVHPDIIMSIAELYKADGVTDIPAELKGVDAHLHFAIAISNQKEKIAGIEIATEPSRAQYDRRYTSDGKIGAIADYLWSINSTYDFSGDNADDGQAYLITIDYTDGAQMQLCLAGNKYLGEISDSSIAWYSLQYDEAAQFEKIISDNPSD